MFVVKIMCSWFVILSAVDAAATQPISPKSVRLAGDNLELMCTVGNGSTVMWDLTPTLDSTKSVVIASSRNQPTNSRYKVDCNTPGTCRLLITDIRLTDAGLYRCLETTIHGLDTRPLVDLTILAAVPTCATVMTYTTSKLLEDLKIRCQVNYSGSKQPFIHCQELSTNKWPSPATPVDTGNSSYHSLSFTYDIDIDRITYTETRLECVTFLNRNDFPHGRVQYTWRWSSDTDDENRVVTQSGSSPPELTTTTTSVEASSSSSSTNQDGTLGVVIVVVCAVLGVVIVCVLIGVAVVRKRTSQVRYQGDSQQQQVHSNAVYQSSTDQQHGHVETASRHLPTADAIYENVPRQEPHYINLNPSTVELPSRTPKTYTRLNVRKGVQTKRDLVEH